MTGIQRRPAPRRAAKRRSALVLLTAIATVVGTATTGFVSTGPAAAIAEFSSPQTLPGKYIIVLTQKIGTAKNAPSTQDQNLTLDRVRARLQSNGIHLERQYRHALYGFAASLSRSQLDDVQADPGVAYVVRDGAVSADANQSPAGWGLDRIDQRALPVGAGYDYSATGAGVSAYVIDSGIRLSHSDFGGRASSGYTAVQDGHGVDDCNGHGTHVAGTLGGSSHGVAKDVRLVAVRVLGCNGKGTWSGVIAGIDWVTANHNGPSVANLSLGGSANQAVDDAVSASIASGVTYTVSAGNSADSACAYSPARTPEALTVGGTTTSTTTTNAVIDKRDSAYSNYGPCLDLFAPGTAITSDWNTSDTATATLSGTSSAAPQVAGVAAQYLQQNPAATPAAVRQAIVTSATPGVIAELGLGSPNLLLYNGFILGRADPNKDFNGDGRADLLALYDYGAGAAGLFVFPGTNARGDAASAPYRAWYTTPGHFTVAAAKVASGDFTGDGKSDLLALYDYGSGAVGLWVFPGTSGHGDAASVPYRVWYTGSGFDVSTAKVTAGDYTGDGRTDALVVMEDAFSTTLWVFPGTAARGDTASVPYRSWHTSVQFGGSPSTWHSSQAQYAAGDFTGDGKADLIALYDYRSDSAGVFVFPGTSSTLDRAVAPQRVWYAASGFTAATAKIAAGDVDDDGKADLMALYDYGSSAAGLLVFPGIAAPTTNTTPYRTLYTGPGTFNVGLVQVTAGRYNGDHLSDLVTLYNYGSSAAGTFLFTGTTRRGDTAAERFRTWYAGPGSFNVGLAKVG